MRSSIGKALGLALGGWLGLVGLGACGSETATNTPGGEPQGKNDIVETATQVGHYDTLVGAIRAGDLEGRLQGRGPFTLFAPTDEAFSRLAPGTLPRLMDPKNKSELRDVLEHHVVQGRLTEADLKSMRSVRTLGGKDLPIAVVDGKVHVGGATITKPDIPGSNGVIQGIDTVLMPK